MKYELKDKALHTVLSVFGQRPLFGNRKPGGKNGETFWMVFFKTKI